MSFYLILPTWALKSPATTTMSERLAF
ncbi:LOW QUALITY PROTEIN: putative translocase of inner mitochondrial membrane [Schistosoma mansoni]|nr:LOW QUALITY PROTEIN: putative translocase of inner mitochondrial membrane [Schistosoma mansoni]|eukprot:XP_018651063.1 LOW QUALITY PROTEIN: putative translocase of inner mitochondrial membrane [Schistosoma mansoni]